MAVPKKAKSKAKRNSRRAHHALKSNSSIVSCPNCGEAMQLHRICPSCGQYKGKEEVYYEED